MASQKAMRRFRLAAALPITLIQMIPFYILLAYAVKSTEEIARTGLAVPTAVHWENFAQAIELSGFYRALKNSVLTTLPTIVLLILLGAPAAYVLARNSGSRLCNTLYSVMLGAMMIPFQAIMLPVYTQLKELGLLNSIPGYVLVKGAFLLPSTIVLVTGFVKSIPADIEDAAAVDGMHPFMVFWRIVFPLMHPILITVGAMNFFNVWNDFSISLVILQKESLRTLPLTQFFFFSSWAAKVNLAFAACLLSLLPTMIVYFALQKYISRGVAAGAVKG